MKTYTPTILRSFFKNTLLGFFLVIMLSACSATNKSQSDQQETVKRDLSHLEELYWQRVNEAKMAFVQADVDFMSAMIVHHAQALVMAQLAPSNSSNRSIQTLAARIINAQQDEIATMQNWLRDRNQPVPIISIDGINLNVDIELPRRIAGQRDTTQRHGHSGSVHDSEDHADMPGMLTLEQLEELNTLNGSSFDRSFLTYMIAHHEGAVIMVNELFAADGAGNDEESYRLAADIYAEQVTEIDMMKLMLERMETSPSSQ